MSKQNLIPTTGSALSHPSPTSSEAGGALSEQWLVKSDRTHGYIYQKFKGNNYKPNICKDPHKDICFALKIFII